MRTPITLFVFLLYFKLGSCLYEDQIGKFDWKQNYLGRLKFSSIDSKSAVKRTIVTTEQNVVAAIALRSGDVIWRHILERGDQGVVQLLHVDSEVVTVSGSGPYFVRAWNINSGFLLYEWTIQTDKSLQTKWIVRQGKLYQVNIRHGTQPSADVIVYNVNSEEQIRTHSIQLPGLEQRSLIVLLGLNIAYTSSSGKLTSYSLIGGTDPRQLDIPTSVKCMKAIESPEDAPAAVLTFDSEKMVFAIVNNAITVLQSHIPAETGVALQSTSSEGYLLLKVQRSKGDLEITGSVTGGGTVQPAISGRVSHDFALVSADISSVFCVPRKDNSPACQMLLSTKDDAIVLLHTPDKIIWVREEALASIVTVDMVDLPVSDVEVAIEKEFDSKETGCFGMFVRRLVSQVMQLQAFLLSVVTLGGSSSNANGRADLVRDKFGLHKMIVIATSVGKVFGIDNFSGEIIWQVLVPDVVPYSVSSKPHIPLFVQRTTRHFPFPAQCVLLFKHKVTTEGVLYVFNPITGQSLDGDIVRLGYAVKQTLMLHTVSNDFIKGIILMDDKDRIHVYPESSKVSALQVAKSTYLFTADPANGVLTGYTLGYSTSDELLSTPIWQIKLNQKITSIVAKNPIEKVHSQGRVLGDRSVLYKYINPNLVAVVTQVEDPIHKNVLSVYLIDVVSGAIVYSTVQKRATEPIHVVHSENWLVYSYFSDKTRRTEVSTLELYEGKVQSNTTAFSSVSNTVLPIVERQAYIFPAGVESMKETITEKGITSKHVLVSLNTGGILELPWLFLDPRRPMASSLELKEEGVILYAPELPIHAEAIINYNQTMLRVQGIHTSPSGLESTCLVFVYGLDLFYTRVAPSKTFDMLKEDFDHVLITVVLLALSISAYVTKKLASRKALKQAWK